ncbi:MAG: hypothetical protein D6739_07335, partial [Nitrospirae bacterium]
MPLEKLWDVSRLDALPGRILVTTPAAPVVHAASLARAVGAAAGLVPCGGVTATATLLCDATVTASSTGGAGRERALRRTVGRVLRLRADPRVAAAEPDYLVHPLAAAGDPLYPLQWDLPLIGVPEAWETTTGDPAVVVAVVDTGVVPHPDLAGRLLPGYDFVRDPWRAGDGDGDDPDATDPGDGLSGEPSSWHGTHVAGTIAAVADNGAGIAGIAPGCRLLPVRVLGRGGGDIVDVLEGIRYAAGLPNRSGMLPDHPAAVINLSLGGARPGGRATPVEQEVIDQARAAGALLVASAGNNGEDPVVLPNFPAAAPGVLSVAAVDAVRERASYSYFGPTVDLAAPGGDMEADRTGDGRPDGILSTYFDGATGEYDYAYLVGTSMAAPHVSAVAALCLAANPDLTADEVERILLATAVDLGPPGRDDAYGAGLVDAAAAVRMAVQGPPRTTLGVAPAVLDFGTDASRLEVALTNTGLTEILVDDPVAATSDGGAWLTARLTPGTVTPMVVEVDRTGLAPGRYAGRVALHSSGGDRVVEVSMEVAEGAPAADVGVVTVRLLDPATGRVVARTETNAAQGYAFAFDRVPAGSYYLTASSDLDGDGVLCEAGEVCGAYPVQADPAPVAVADGAAVEGLTFTLTYQGVEAGAPAAPGPPDATAEVERLTALLGTWEFTYTIVSTFTDTYTLEAVEFGGDGPFLSGSDAYGGVVVADLVDDPTSAYDYYLYDPGSILDQLFLFDVAGDTAVGQYWMADPVSGDLLNSLPYAMTGLRLAGRGRAA